MNPITAKNAIAFLARVDLKGAETPAFQEVVQTIQGFIPAEEAVEEKVEDKPE